jgi:hypothetical protein
MASNHDVAARFGRREDLIALGAAGLGLAGLVAFGDSSTWWICPVHAFTGLLCPGCGLQTSLLKALNGEVIAAVSHNPTFLVGPALVGAATLSAKFSNHAWSRAVIVVTVAYVVTFTILRNAVV